MFSGTIISETYERRYIGDTILSQAFDIRDESVIPAFPKSRISKVMYKARCRRSREDARGPKKNREIHLRLHLSYFLYNFPPADTEYPFIFTGQDLSPNKTIVSSVYLVALHPAITELMTARAILIIYLSSVPSSMGKQIAGKVFENTKMDMTFDE